MTEWIQVGGPCRRQCDVDKDTLICQSCGMYYGKPVKNNVATLSCPAHGSSHSW